MEFRPLEKFPGYEISEYGDILNTKTWVIRKVYIRNGYKSTQFTVKGQIKNFYVHRLVAETYHERPRPYKRYNYVNHIKLGDKLNCHKSNVEWCTQAQNIQHFYANRALFPEYHKDASFA